MSDVTKTETVKPGGETAGDLFKAGKLTAAVEAANAAVRKAPSDAGARLLLAELLVFAGNLERADVILDAAGDIEPEAMMVLAEFRQLLRADLARRQWRRDGRVPEFLGEPTPAISASMAAMVALRAGDAAQAAKSAMEAEALRPRIAGREGKAAFDDFRDVDDLCGGYFEVLTTTGKYFWIPTERVESVDFHPPKRPRDLCWRRCSMSVSEGPDGDVYVPVTYGSEDPALEEPFRLGRATDWRETAGAAGETLVRGVGQRVFLVGEEARNIMELGSLIFGPE